MNMVKNKNIDITITYKNLIKSINIVQNSIHGHIIKQLNNKNIIIKTINMQ